VAYIENWDSGQPNAFWDVGLQWDVNVGPSPGDVQPYLDLVTSEHADKPNFMAMIAAVLQPLCDSQTLLAAMPTLYDLDVAVGSQLDTTGQWIGVTRIVEIPLAGVYFSFDTAGLGFDQGTWFNSGEPSESLVSLPDPAYRILLYARAAANQWNGTIPGAYAAWNILFQGTGIGILIQDEDDMHMIYALTGPVPDAVTTALFTGGYLDLVPAGVEVDDYLVPSVPDAPYFGFGVENSSISGFGVGAWGVSTIGG
jgi:hypothetical protein